MRLGGDEFVVLLEALEDPRTAITIARRIVQEISKPFQLGDRFVTVGTSVGVAYIDQRVNDPHEALRNADTAMYRAKNSGKGQVAVFDQTMHDAVVARMDLEDELRQAVDHGAFQLNYQPIVDLTQGTIQGVEVLLRWTMLDGSTVSPAVFIPVLEEIGMISRVGEWVLENSMRDFSNMLGQLPQGTSRNIYLGVNVSQRQLSDPFFHEQLESVLKRTGFDRKLLRLEMNESNDARSVEQSLNTMRQLHSSGVGIQIDNFGKGQSSLNCFQTYPVETVKIDRSFTASIATERSHSAITQAIVQLAHNLSARIVAEGVESAEQFNVLRQWGCDAAQGYLFCPPLTCDELGKFLCDPMQSEGMQLFANRGAPIVTSTNVPLSSPTPTH
jgi:EAL domain-containing protein (putative c-di-GMP-specific phosphodiesterase class I)